VFYTPSLHIAKQREEVNGRILILVKGG
jgi:hypothetical protein